MSHYAPKTCVNCNETTEQHKNIDNSIPPAKQQENLINNASNPDKKVCFNPCLIENPPLEREPCKENPYSLNTQNKSSKKGDFLTTNQQEMQHATAGHLAPNTDDPTIRPKPPQNERPVPQNERACYLPQPEDGLLKTNDENMMGPIGPWATGRLDWSPLAGLTGTRPIVDKYSIARYSEGEWRKHNKDILDLAENQQHNANLY